VQLATGRAAAHQRLVADDGAVAQVDDRLEHRAQVEPVHGAEARRRARRGHHGPFNRSGWPHASRPGARSLHRAARHASPPTTSGTSGAAARRDEARERLSEREHEVALAIGQGGANAEIAAELHMSVATVKAHDSHVLDKLDVDNRVRIALLVHDAEAA